MDPKTKKAFFKIKDAISSTHVLAKLDFVKDFIIYTNATEEVVYAILLHKDEENYE